MKKKILFITNAFTCGGIESALYDLIVGMNKDIFDITVFALYKGHEWDEKFQNTGVRVVFATPELKNPYNIFERLKIRNDYKKLAKSKESNGEGMLDVFFRESFDLIICYHGYSNVAACFSLGETAKTIEYVHCAVDSNPAVRKDVLREAQAIQKCDKIICVSQMAKAQIDNLLGVADKTLVAHNPINYQRVHELAENGDWNQDSPYICAIGNFVKGKKFTMLVKIFGQLLEDGLACKLVIVGDGPEMQNIRTAIEENHLSEYVHLTGYQSNPYPILKNAKLLIISSFNEGMPVVAMEALCMGVPVVSAYPSVQELFGEEVCGMITESTEEGLYRGLKKVLSDEELYHILKQGAIKRSEYYKNDSDLKRIERIYLELLEDTCAQ